MDERKVTLRLFAVALVWILVVRYVPAYAVYVLPPWALGRLTLQAYLLVMQVVTTGIGVGLAAAVLPRAREGLAVLRLTAFQTVASLLSGPGVFVIASAVAIGAALPTLAEELRREGVEAMQRNAGEFGRALREAPALLTVLWGVLFGPVAEELLFRGVLWSAITCLTSRWSSATKREPSSLDAFVAEAAVLRGARASARLLLDGGIATLLAATLFAAMHADMKGGVGIVRVVSTACLGLACGMARHATGSVLSAMIVHLVYNLASLGQTRHWWNVLGLGSYWGISTLAVLVGALCAGALALAFFVRRARYGPPAPTTRAPTTS